MKIFTDFHHSGLYNALHLTLEKRLGYQLYAPIGMEWEKEGYWLIHQPYNFSQDTAHQYLDLRDVYFPTDGTPPLTAIEQEKKDHYLVQDFSYEYTRKHITLDQFKAMDIDIIIASIPAHYVAYKKLRDKYKPKAKVVCHAGNMFSNIQSLAEQGVIENFMGSTIEIPLPPNIPKIFYHQEINQEIFKYTELENLDRLFSFVIGLPKREVYDTLKKLMPEFRFRAFGADQGFVVTSSDIALKMEEATMGVHVKPRGDGFGHVLYSWAFSGRPIITFFSDYQDKLGGELLVDGETAINLDGRKMEDVVTLIKTACQEKNIEKMSKAIHKRVTDRVNYDSETAKIKTFLENDIR